MDSISSSEERSRHSGNIPAAVTQLMGRDQAVQRALGRVDETRMLTFAGPPGVGKTELALEVARRTTRQAGSWYVALETVDDPTHLASAILGGLEIVETPGRDPVDVLTDHIGELDFLVLLDNCEQLLAPLADICTHLLTACPELSILATSTTILGVDGEAMFRVGGLPYEDGVDSPAVKLFLRRARAVSTEAELPAGDLEAIAHICSRLEGNPLAIGLAASRLTALGPQDILERLSDRFSLLPSYRAAIEWSYALLRQTEQETVRALATFRGGFTLDAARAVCDTTELTTLNRLEHLIHSSWVNSPVEGRFRMLETLRLFAAAKAEANTGEWAAVRARHATYYMELADQARRDSFGPNAGAALAMLSLEDANHRAALDTLLALDRPSDGLHLVVSLGNYWIESARHDQAQRSLPKVLAAVGDVPSMDSVRAWADLAVHKMLAGLDADSELATLARHAEATGDPVSLSRWHRTRATAAYSKGDYAGAFDELETGITLLGDASEGLRAQPLSSLVQLAVWLGRYEAAESYLQQLTDLVRRRGTTRTRPLPQYSTAWLRLYQGEAQAAIAAADEAIGGFSESGLLIYVYESLVVKAMAALTADENEHAFDAARRAQEMSDRFGYQAPMMDAHSVLGRVAARRSELGPAAEHFIASIDGFVERDDDAGIMWSAFHTAGFLGLHEHEREAAFLHGKAAAIRDHRHLVLPAFSAANLETQKAGMAAQLGDAELEALLAAGAELDHRAVARIVAEACTAVAG